MSEILRRTATVDADRLDISKLHLVVLTTRWKHRIGMEFLVATNVNSVNDSLACSIKEAGVVYDAVANSSAITRQTQEEKMPASLQLYTGADVADCRAKTIQRIQLAKRFLKATDLRPLTARTLHKSMAMFASASTLNALPTRKLQ